jgi:NTE family protein
MTRPLRPAPSVGAAAALGLVTLLVASPIARAAEGVAPSPASAPAPEPTTTTTTTTATEQATMTEPATATSSPRRRVCLVLSGGGARGAAHIGVLKVLEELRVPIDCVVGTSMGSIVGAAYASGLSPEQIATVVRDADWDALLSDSPPRAERSVYTKELERARVGSAELGLRRSGLVLPQGFLVGHQLHFFLQRIVAQARVDRFDDLPIPYRAIATDFENGGMVVMDRGDLATAIRASMSVPGAFAPVERDGRLLVDGGLVRNLPIDVARALGADAVIAVNLGSPLLKRSELTSFVSAAEQTLNILTEQNVQGSLAQLAPGDVLVAPDLGTLGAGDFKRAMEGVPIGEQAARAVAAQLQAFAVDEATYAQWRERQRRAPATPTIRSLRVDTSGLKYVPPPSVEAVFAGVATERDLQLASNELLGTDDFQRIEARAEDGPDGTSLVLRPIEKSWGPNYVRGGLSMDADVAGNSNFTVYVDHRATWLNSRGLEWRNRASVGQFNRLETELRQPLDRAREWFVAPRFEFSQAQRDFFNGEDAIATYRSRFTGVEFDAGRRFGNYGEAVAGLVLADVGESRVRGARGVAVDVQQRIAAWRAALTIDRLDSLDFPQTGIQIDVNARFARAIAGGDAVYDRVSAGVQQAFGGGNSSMLLALRYDTALGGPLPIFDAFSAGGFLNLSGYQRDEILASRMTTARAVYRHRVAGGTSVLPGLYVGASLEGADVSTRLNGPSPLRTLGGSLFLSAESVLGPFYLGIGWAEGGRTSLYLTVGRP